MPWSPSNTYPPFVDSPHFDRFAWPCSKFSFKRDDIFGHLYERFNTAPIAILEPEAWHADVVDLVSMSKTLDELYTRMEERKKQRLDELVYAINHNSSFKCWRAKPRSPLYNLCNEMKKLRYHASVFGVAESFAALEAFAKQQSERYSKIYQEKRKAWEEEDRKRSLEKAIQPVDDRDTVSADSASDARANTETSTASKSIDPLRSKPSPSSAPSSSLKPSSQSTHSSSKPSSSSPKSSPTTPSPSKQTRLDDTKTTNDKKRKNDGTQDEPLSSKKPCATSPPTSPPSLCSDKTSPSSDGRNCTESAQQDEATSIFSQSYPRKKMPSFDQKQPESVSDELESLPDCIVDAEEDVIGRPIKLPPVLNPNLDSSQLPEFKINYTSLGWRYDPGPSDKALPSDVQHNKVDTLGIGSGPARPQLEQEAKRQRISKPTTTARST